MNDIQPFIAENREIAKTQAQRWEGVDPSRLLQALDYLEQLTTPRPPYQQATGASGSVMAAMRFSSLTCNGDAFGPCELILELREYLDRPVVSQIIDAIRADGDITVTVEWEAPSVTT